MTTRIVLIDGPLPRLTVNSQSAWREWLARHELPDPVDIPIPTTIICDDQARTITIDYLVRDEQSGFSNRKTVVVQLEARALPIPSGYSIIVEE